MSSRLSPRNEQPAASATASLSDRTARRRSSAATTTSKASSAPTSAYRRDSHLSPASEDDDDDDVEYIEEINDGARASFSSQPNRTKDRRASIPMAPPTTEDDSFYEDDEPQKADNVLGGWHYAPLLIAIIPPVGAVLGGQADAWSDAILLLLATFWLYQFLKVPHDIYHAARTRRVLQADIDTDEEEREKNGEDIGSEAYAMTAQRRRERVAAAAELRRAEMISLAALVLSPVAGAWLLTWMMDVFTDGNRYLNKFNIRLFMLASGIKPWSHALSLFRRRLLHLQEVVHYPSSRVEGMSKRLARLESDLTTLRKLVATKSDVTLLREGIDMPLTQLSRSMRRYEKKEEFLRMSAEDKFSLVESRLEDLLREVAINAELIEEERRERQRAASLPASIFQALRYALGQRTQEHAYEPLQRALPGSMAQLGITSHPSNGNGKISGSVSSPETSPTYAPLTRYGPPPPPPPQVSTSPAAWAGSSLTTLALLPITIPRSVIRGALSFAGGQMSAARDDHYAQTFAAVTSNSAVGSAATTPTASTVKSNMSTNGAPNVLATGTQPHRISTKTNGKSRSTFNDRLDTRTAAAPVGAPSHYSRRV